jgi:hypothetical protein
MIESKRNDRTMNECQKGITGCQQTDWPVDEKMTGLWRSDRRLEE